MKVGLFKASKIGQQIQLHFNHNHVSVANQDYSSQRKMWLTLTQPILHNNFGKYQMRQLHFTPFDSDRPGWLPDFLQQIKLYRATSQKDHAALRTARSIYEHDQTANIFPSTSRIAILARFLLPRYHNLGSRGSERSNHKSGMDTISRQKELVLKLLGESDTASCCIAGWESHWHWRSKSSSTR